MPLFKKRKTKKGFSEIPEAPEYAFPEAEEVRDGLIKKSEGEKSPQELELPELPQEKIEGIKKEKTKSEELPFLTEGISKKEKKEISAKLQKTRTKHKLRLPSKLTQEIDNIKKDNIKKIGSRNERKEKIEKIKSIQIRRPVFIKIDHFKEILESIDKIEKRVHEVDVIIKKLKEIRLKEDQEMTSWEQEVQEIKSRLEEIEKSLSNI